MLSNRNSSQKEADSLIVTRRGTCLPSPSLLTNQTATSSHTRSNIRVNTPDRSEADVFPGSVSSLNYCRDREPLGELTRSTSDIETGFTRPDRSVLTVRENLLCDGAEIESEVTSC